MAGLNEEYDQVRLQILIKEKILSLNEVISLGNAKANGR